MKYIIGDIHANIAEFTKLIKTLNPKTGDSLIFLGDYLGKNKQTKETLKLLKDLNSRFSCAFIMGNHDFVWDRYLNYKDYKRQEFLQNYGSSLALNQFSARPKQLIKNNNLTLIKKHLKSYLELIPKMVDYILVDNFIVMHAGVEKRQYAQEPLKFTEINYFIRPEKMDLSRKYLDKYIVIAGHTHADIKPMVKPGYINIDLGAGYNGYLGAFCIEEGIVYRSDGAKYKASSLL